MYVQANILCFAIFMATNHHGWSLKHLPSLLEGNFHLTDNLSRRISNRIVKSSLLKWVVEVCLKYFLRCFCFEAFICEKRGTIDTHGIYEGKSMRFLESNIIQVWSKYSNKKCFVFLKRICHDLYLNCIHKFYSLRSSGGFSVHTIWKNALSKVQIKCSFTQTWINLVSIILLAEDACAF